MTSQLGISSPVELRLLDLEYTHLNSENRDPYAPEYTGRWRERAGLNWNISVLDKLYWNNYVHTETVNPSGRVKTVGWKWEAGLEVFEWLDVFAAHHSRHVMEESDASMRGFPVEDSYGIRVIFYEGRKK